MFRTTLCALVLPVVLQACGSTTATLPAGEHIGEPVEARSIETLSTVQAEPSAFFDRTVLVEATVKAVCQSRGCWMQIEDGGQPALVRWETGCGGKYAFPKDAVGERILVQGSFYEKEISADDAAHMEEEAGRDLDIPAKGYELNASAVLLLDRAAQ